MSIFKNQSQKYIYIKEIIIKIQIIISVIYLKIII